MISSVDVGILSKVVTLGKRYGLKLSDLEAFLQYDEQTEHEVLSFPSTPTKSPAMEQFGQMMDDLGCTDKAEVRAKDVDELDAILDEAIRKAPTLKRDGWTNSI